MQKCDKPNQVDEVQNQKEERDKAKTNKNSRLRITFFFFKQNRKKDLCVKRDTRQKKRKRHTAIIVTINVCYNNKENK